MRHPHATGFVAMMVIALGAVVAPMAANAGAAPTRKTPVCAGKGRKAASEAIAAAYDTVMNGTTTGRTLEEKLALVEGADDPAFRAVLERIAGENAEALATTTVRVDEVTCTSRRTADVAFELIVDGAPAPGLTPPGGAVLDHKVWKATQQTACDLVSLADPTVLEVGPCASAIG